MKKVIYRFAIIFLGYYILFHIIFVLTKSWQDLWRNQILGVKLYYQKIRSPYAKAFVIQLIPQCSQKKKDRDIICKRPNNHIKSSRSFILSLHSSSNLFSLFLYSCHDHDPCRECGSMQILYRSKL